MYKRDITYVCCICGETKNESESRYSFKDKEMTQLFCWECHEIIALKKEKENIEKQILRMEKRIKEIDEVLEPNKGEYKSEEDYILSM